ncbi:hypoxanthine phosphoribosyltransferase [Clostridium sp. D2Q-11]|uniref:Hypoxanthine phosphoribosyltransferase n=1 Tax=Anaeromonas frigoriresistens TaxID=2683708 RepID=A0A942Z5L9_9FIRM|nr:hypoxanthine phosphoribosyltransferase [Anaeromonas frigoriresistens]MBS4537576.1 hypoxanthine phosphoribosyltransferase [Anaeromonas frigoriresistens]
MKEDIREVLINEEQLKNKVMKLGKQISKDYEGESLTVICILKGAVMFMTELIKNIEIPIEIDFMDVSSYGNQTTSSGVVKIIKDLDSSIEGKNILIVEDIIDSGLTLNYLMKILKSRSPKSVEICSLLDKPEGRNVDMEVKYVGFIVPDAFLVGYGLDFAEKYRNLPYIGILKEEIYLS